MTPGQRIAHTIATQTREQAHAILSGCLEHDGPDTDWLSDRDEELWANGAAADEVYGHEELPADEAGWCG